LKEYYDEDGSMKKAITLGFLLAFSFSLWSQAPVSSFGDKEIQDLKARVEGVEKSPVLKNHFKPGSEPEKKVSALADAYYNGLLNESYSQVYDMMTADYRKWITRASYLTKNRLSLSKVEIKTIVFESERCARVQGYIWGSSSALGSQLRIPVREYLVQEEGEWRVYQHPFSNSAGVMPPMARNIKKPDAY